MKSYDEIIMARILELDSNERLEYMRRLACMAVAQLEAQERSACLERKLRHNPQARVPLGPLEISEFRPSSAFPGLG